MTTWSEFEKTKKYPKLEGSSSCDVVIIGGGITGILNAYMLSRAGKKVMLIEKSEVGSYATLATTAFLTKVIDSGLAQVASLFGDDTAKKVWESHQDAIEKLERIVKEEDIDCEFVRCSNYLYASDEKEFKEISEEAKEYERLGIRASLAKKSEGGEDLGFEYYGYLEVPDQGKFHVAKFLYALAEKAVNSGAEIYENTKAVEIDKEGESVIVELESGAKITAKDAIVATYKPLTDKSTHFKKGMYVTYVFEVEVPKGTFKEAIYEDNGNPYYYFRIDKGEAHDRMIFGGEDHREELLSDILKNKSFDGLEKYLREIMGDRPYKITKKWYGPILEPSDGLALIGQIEPQIYVATAFSGNGMTYSTISAITLSDLILGKEGSNVWDEIYTPKRPLFHPKRLAVKGKDYVEEFFGGAVKNLFS